MHLITHAVFKACLFLSSGSIIHALHDHHTHAHVQEMPRMGGLRKKMPFTFLAMLFCTFAITGIPFFSGFVSKDRILGDALVLATHHKMFWIPAALGYVGAFLTAFYMFRLMFLTFFGEPRDKELYDHTPKEKLSWNRNVPLLILSIFTLGVFFSGSLTGQGIIKVADHKYEWFQTLITNPSHHLEHFSHLKEQPFGYSDVKGEEHFEPAHYDAEHGMTEEEAHHAHHIHHLGALASIAIAFAGVFLAMMMYLWRSWNPGFWVATFSRWYRALQNKYYFDDFYIKGVIQKGLLPLNNLVAYIDIGIFDRYAIDGWEKVNRAMFTLAKWIDNMIIDTAIVDGTGASVRFFNVILRTIQSGKVQFYFVMIFLVLAGYIWTLNI